MIITLVKADFSAKNIGTVGSFAVLTNVSNATYNGPMSAIKNEAFNATITINNGYEFKSILVTMNNVELTDAVTIDGENIAINITNVTGVIAITVKTALSASELDFTNWVAITGTPKAQSMITAAGYANSTNGVVYNYEGYDWSNYKLKATCRYGTNTSMYAGGFWGTDGSFLGGLWQSDGTATIFNARVLTDADLPSGVTWNDVGKISLCATALASGGLTAPVLELIDKNYYVEEPEVEEPEVDQSVIYPSGVDVEKVFPGSTQYETSSSGHVMEYSGYDWENYDIYATCRYGTTTTMYAVALWGANDTYLGGVWLSDGVAKVFTEEQILDTDLPQGVTWADVEKIGLAWKSGVTPALKLVPKV